MASGNSESNIINPKKQKLYLQLRSYDLLTTPKLGKAVIFNNETFIDKLSKFTKLALTKCIFC